MKTVILFNSKYPSIGAASKRVQNYEKGLKQAGVNTSVVSIPPFTSNPILLLINPFYVIINLLRKDIECNILFIYGFGWVSKLFIVIYGKIKGFCVVFEVNEKNYSIRDAGRRDKLLKYAVPINIYFLTHIVFPLVDGFVVISEALLDYVSKYASKKCTLIKIPIIVDYEYYSNFNPNRNGLLKPYIIHTATLNDNKDGIIAVFKAFIMLHIKYGKKLHFYLSNKKGLKPILNNIKELISKSKLNEYVHFLDEPNDDILINYQANADMTIINKLDTEQNRFNFATKIGEYLALGIPIITTNIGEVKKYLKDNVDCIYIQPNNYIEIADKIAMLLDKKELVQQISRNSRNIALKHFSIDSNCYRLKKYFEQLLEKS